MASIPRRQLKLAVSTKRSGWYAIEVSIAAIKPSMPRKPSGQRVRDGCCKGA
jgi:hypothetical protein